MLAIWSNWLAAQVTAYSETFTGQNGKGNVGSVFDTSGVNWWINTTAGSFTASSDYFAVQSEQFEAQDVDGDVYWYSDTVSISGLTSLKISLDVGANGDFEASGDVFRLILYVDGSAYTLYQEDVHESEPDDPMYWDNKILSSTLRTFDTIVPYTGSVASLEIVANNNAGTEQYFFDNLTVTGSPASAGNLGPGISNIHVIPDPPTSLQTLNVFARITDDSNLDTAYVLYGINSGNLSTGIAMGTVTSDTMGTLTSIPAFPDSTTIYYMVVAIDDSGATDSSAEMSYMVLDPVVFGETYAQGFSDCGNTNWIPYSEAESDQWTCGSGQYSMNGSSGSPDIDWLISAYPFDFSSYLNEQILVFTQERFGDAINQANEFELRYSIDYDGSGDPTSASWTVLNFTPNNTSTGSSLSALDDDTVDASSIPDTAYLAFYYNSVLAPSDEDWRVDSIYIYEAITPEVSLTDIDGQVQAGTLNQGEQNAVLFQARLYSTNSQNFNLTGASFTSNGTYAPSDLDTLELFVSADSVFNRAAATRLSTVPVIGTAGNQLFDNFASAYTVPAGDSAYFFITADVDVAATAGNTLGAGALDFTYQGSVNETDNTNAGGLQTIQSVTPTVVLYSLNPAVPQDSIFDNSTFNAVYRFDLAGSVATAQLDSVDLNFTGTYSASDISNTSIFSSDDTIFNPAADNALDVAVVNTAAGNIRFRFTETILADDTTFFFVSVDAPCGLTPGATIGLNALTTADLYFSGSVSKSGTASAGGTHILGNATPADVTGLNAASSDDSSATVSWVSPLGCADSVLVAVTNTAFTTARPGTVPYSSDTCYGMGDAFDGGWLVYKGKGTSVNVGCLDSGTTYTIKIFSFNGDSVSAGVTTSVTPISQPSYPGTSDAWINEFHYDNISTDDDEWAEIVVKDTSAYALADFSIALYNGSGGALYGSLTTIAEVSDNSGYTLAAFKQTGSIQNGPDGLALVYQDSIAVQFLSYEGSFTASGGPADGMMSADIGVEEDGATLLGQSLQLQGAGTRYTDFTWAKDVDTTWGEINEDQFFGEVTTYSFNGSWAPADPSGISTPFDSLILISDSAYLTTSTSMRYARIESGAGLAVAGGDSLLVRDSLVIDADGFTSYGQLIGKVSGTIMWNTVLASGNAARWFNLAVPVKGRVGEIQLSSGAINTLSDAAAIPGGNDTDQTNIWYYDTDSLDPSTGEGLWRPLVSGDVSADSTGWSVYLGNPYFGNLPINLSLKGIANNASCTYEVDTNNAGWNFIPNPYPSAISWNAFHAGNSGLLNSTYYIFDDGVDSQYVGWNPAAGTPPINSTEITQYIAPGQAFFVQAIDEGTLQFANSQRAFSLGSIPSLFSTQAAEGIWMVARQANGRYDYAFTGFVPGAGDSYNNTIDGVKMSNWAKGTPNLAVDLLGKPYMFKFVEKQFTKRTIPVSFQSHTDQVVDLYFEFRSISPSWTVTLEDLQTGRLVSLPGIYTFSHKAGNNPKRFLLHIDQVGVELSEERATEIISYFEDGDLVVDVTRLGGAGLDLKLLDVNGRLIRGLGTRGKGLVRIPMNAEARGVYILQVDQNGNSLLHRKLLKY